MHVSLSFRQKSNLKYSYVLISHRNNLERSYFLLGMWLLRINKHWMPWETSSLFLTTATTLVHVDVLMNHYGVDNPWTKAFSLDTRVLRSLRLRPVMCLNGNQDVLLQVNNKSLVWYQHRSKTVINVTIY